MNSIETILPRAETLVFLLNVAVAATVTCAAGLVAAKCLRDRSAPLRYALLTSTLTIALLSPALVLLVGYGGFGAIGFTIDAVNSNTHALSDVAETEIVAMIRGNGETQVASQASTDSPRPSQELSLPMRVAGARGAESRRTSFEHASVGTQEDRDAEASASRLGWWRVVGTLLTGAWGVGVLVVLAALGRGWLAVVRLRRSLRRPSDPRIERLATRAARALSLRRDPPVFQSAMMPVPISLGLMRPAIIVPEDIHRRLDDAQLEAVLVHETAHIAHRDHWVGLIGRLAAALFWWQPMMRRVNGRLADLREDICDNYVVRRQGNGRAYARVLVELAARTIRRPALPVAIGLLENEYDGLEGRVRRLLHDNRKTDTRLSARAAGVVALFMSALAGVLLVASVRAERAAPKKTVESQSLSTVNVKTRDALLRAARDSKPGTKILIAPGNYRGGIVVNNLRGEKGKPIILAAADPKNPPVISGGKTGLHLTDPAYVELHDLVITKTLINGVNIDDGGSYETPAHHVVLRGLVVRDIGSVRNHDGIKLSGLDKFRVERCTVQRWGKTGSGIDMVGCHRGVITDSTFRDGDKIYGNAVQTKGGSRDITVRRCRFENAGGRAVNLGGSTGLAYFRPKSPGYEAKDITVEDCTFIGSMAPIAFVGVDGANVHHNTFFRPTRWIIRILQENQGENFVSCRNGRFTNNLVFFRSDELASPVNLGAKTSPETFKFAENFWYCLDRPEKTQRAVRLPTPEKNGVYGKAPGFRDAAKGDLRLTSESRAKAYGPRTNRKK